MKITKSYLKQVIKEELERLQENRFRVPRNAKNQVVTLKTPYGSSSYRLSKDKKHVVVLINDEDHYFVEVYKVTNGLFDNVNVEATEGTGGHGTGQGSGENLGGLTLEAAKKLFTQMVDKYTK